MSGSMALWHSAMHQLEVLFVDFELLRNPSGCVQFDYSNYADNYVDDTHANGTTQCEAFTYGDAVSKSWSEQISACAATAWVSAAAPCHVVLQWPYLSACVRPDVVPLRYLTLTHANVQHLS